MGDVGGLDESDIDYDDYYTFELTENGTVELKLSNLSSDAQLYLYDNDGKSGLVSSTSSGTTDETIGQNLRAGTYYIRVYGYEPTTYQLDVSATVLGSVPEDQAGDDFASAKNLGLLSGRVVASNDFIGDFNGLSQDSQDYYKFELAEDSVVELALSGLSANANIALYESDGVSSLGGSFNSGTDDDVISRSLRAGTYYLAVSGSTTMYRLEALATPTDTTGNSFFDTATDLGVVSEAMRATEYVLDDENYIDYYKLKISENSTLNVNLSGLDSNAQLNLYRNNGTLHFDSAAAANSTALNRVVTAGTYYLAVSSNAEDSGTYRLETSATLLGPIPADEAGERIDTAKDLGTLGRDYITANEFIGNFNGLNQDDRDFYKIQVSENSAVSFKVSDLNEYGSITLYNNDATRQILSVGADENAIATINQNLRKGTYYVSVSGGYTQGITYQLEASAIAIGQYQDDAGNTLETARDIGVSIVRVA